MQATTSEDFGFGTQIRKSPYFDATVHWGAKEFSVYNHMYIPRSFGDPEQNFWNLVNDAILCDVSVERQVEISGPDAAEFVQLLTPRDLSTCEVGQCKYVLITNAEGGILNDPVLLRLDTNRFWLSLADSDILLWAKGVAVYSNLNVNISEPDVSPLQLQGPKSGEIAAALFGESILDMKYYWLRDFVLEGIPLIVSRTGWSSELGYEIYLCDSAHGTALWNKIMAVGEPLGLKAGHTSSIRRIEGGMLSYHADMNSQTNPFELGLDRLVDLDMRTDFIGKSALRKIKDFGVKRRQVGIEISGAPLPTPNTRHWKLMECGTQIGVVTSAVYSPRLKKNIALGMIEVDYSSLGTNLDLMLPGENRSAKVVNKPFYDPQKRITAAPIHRANEKL